MSKRRFTGPFWFMLALGVVASCFSVIGFKAVMLHAPNYLKSTMSKLSFFYLPAIICIEAIMYWMVRKRNRCPRASWSHVVLFAFAYFAPLVKEFFVTFYLVYSPTSHLRSYMRTVGMIQAAVFWGLMILAHIFFAQVLIKSFSANQEETAASENMLDDVLS